MLNTINPPKIVAVKTICGLANVVREGRLWNVLSPHPNIAEFLLGVLKGLEYIHSQSIIHGDLKGTNVLVDEQGSPRICDFGSSRIECACYDGPSIQPSTLAWDSPERWWPTTTRSTKQSDIWSFGCVALEVQMGLLPWDIDGTGITTDMHDYQYNDREGTPAIASNPKLDLEGHPIKMEVWNLMTQCWEIDPQQRPTAAELLEQIQNLNPAAA
ncbi:tyrosine kinase domain protein, partial [Rhizoctonia solani AG-3 Rhs1AP]